MALHYLTVQDILWINLQLTKKVQHFNYARLEEATFYQYAYGESRSLMPQAARFLTGFSKMRPFETGNDGTAFVATVTFLEMNGRTLSVPDEEARAWFKSALCSLDEAQAAIEKATTDHTVAHHDLPAVQSVAQSIVDRYSSALAGFDGLPAAAAAK